MIVRGKDPGKGMLSLPGGFIDPDERAEDAAARECREEAGVEATDLSFVGSWPNDYAYRDVLYKTCDLYFSARAATPPRLDAEGSGEVAGLRLIEPCDIETAPIAFESARRALLAWRLREKGR
jgi:8-oxo-dGTP pyrophosphatase MutT (NUDIX family)